MRARPIPFRLGMAVAYVKQWSQAAIASAVPWIAKTLTDPQPQALILAQADCTTVVTKDAGCADLRREVFDGSLSELAGAAGERVRALCAQRELRLSIAESDVFFLRLALPKSAVRNAREAIKYRLLTEAPLRPDELLFDARIAAAHIDGGAVAEVAVCRRQSVDDLKARAEQAGLAASHLGWTRLDGVDLEFTFARAPGVQTSSARLLRNCLLALGPLAISILALLASWSYASWKESVLLDDIAALSHRQADALRLQARRAQLTRIEATLNTERAPIPTAQLLNILGRTLPRSAWLSELRLDGVTLRLIGNAADPTAAAAAVAKTAGFSAVRLEAVTADATAGQQPRFEISADIAIKGKN